MAIGVIFYMGMGYQVELRKQYAITFNVKPYIIYVTIFPICMGVLLRLPKLIVEIKDKKKWSLDWMKLIIIGMPTLYIAMIPFLGIVFGKKLLFTEAFMLLGDMTLISIAGVIFGYVLLDSLTSKYPRYSDLKH